MTSAPDFVTIIIPFADQTEWSPMHVADVTRAIERLGNPAHTATPAAPDAIDAPDGHAPADLLDATGIVHFMSINVIPAERDDAAPHLLIEATVDGPAHDAVRTIGAAMGEVLAPVLELVTGQPCAARAVPGLLRRHALGLAAGPWRWRKQAIGLPFSGTPGTRVAEIHANRAVVAEARKLIAAYRLREPLAEAPALLRHVAANLPAAAAAVVARPQPDLPFVDQADAPWEDYARNGLTLSGLGRVIGYHRGPLVLVLALSYALVAGLLWRSGIGTVLTLILAVLPALLLPVVLVGMLAWRLRADEQANTPRDVTPAPDAIAAMLARENPPGFVHNHMISITTLRAAPIRRLSLPVAFRAVATGIATRLLRPGFLSTIGTIHAARWLVVPGTRQLVFLSNFDGSWESYLEDFIIKASEGVSAIWSNTEGFPATQYLFQGGAADGDRMKRFARASMQPTAFWYSAYPALSCTTIRKQALIVSGLRKATSLAAAPDDAQAWLDLFGTIPRPADALQYAEIQAIAFGGLRRHPHSRMVAIDFAGDDMASARNWLADLYRRDLITFGDRPTPDLVANIAFSARGLARLGLKNEVAGTAQGFPGVFASGMADPGRRRALNDPAKLEWSDADADAVLLLYARPPSGDSKSEAAARAAAAFDAEIARATAQGLVVRTSIDTGLRAFDADGFARRWHADPQGLATTAAGPVDGSDDQENTDGLTVEPFGFVDGISQPQVRGFPGRAGAGDPLHAVEPGEFILGYADNRGNFPPSPQLARPAADGTGLDGGPRQQPGSFPDFAHRPAPLRDFGRNGSYLVIRQLHQDIAGFEQQLTLQAQALQTQQPDQLPHPGNLPRTREWIAAKMVGRWRDGSPLAEHPVQPVLDDGRAALAGNGFLLGATDPQGQRCPFGSHIRRAFPRDSLSPGDPLGLQVTNRHRLLRRGRPYLNENGEPAGTLFMCLNADIERQFEFVQQTWLASPTFHGLDGERDPFALHAPVPAGTVTAGETFGIPGPRGGCALQGLQRHVTLHGGGYFFLPGRHALRFLAGES